jgi:hypothetical protein
MSEEYVMVIPRQQGIQFRLNAAAGVGPVDNGLHHLMGVRLQVWIGHDFVEAAEPEHVAPHARR